MGYTRKTAQEQYALITECRQSGLSDALWCRQNGIAPSTLYSWIARLREKGCGIPESEKGVKCVPAPAQDVVKIDIVPDAPDIRPAHISGTHDADAHSISIELAGANIKITNDASPELIASVINILRGSSW